MPLTTDVPRKHEMRRVRARSRSLMPVRRRAVLSAGSDSPVSIDCWTDRSRDSSSRASAGTRSPADSRKTSPGTTFRNGVSSQRPRADTVAVGLTDARSRSAACCER